MRHVLFLVAIVVMATAAHAANPQFSKAQLCQVVQPCEAPARYASGPFLATPVVRQVSLPEVQAICGGRALRPFFGARAASMGTGIMGCARFDGSACVVHVPKDVKAAIPDLYDVILRHELAHCRGWVH